MRLNCIISVYSILNKMLDDANVVAATCSAVRKFHNDNNYYCVGYQIYLKINASI